MFTRLYPIIIVMLTLISACAPTGGVDVFEVGIEPADKVNSNEAIKDELQPILQAMLGGNIAEQLVLLEYTRTPCIDVEGLGGPPPCPEGVAEGTTVEVFPLLGSEGSYVKPEEMEQILTASWVKSLYAVYRVTPGPNDEAYFPVGEYAMIFERDVNDLPLPVTLRVLDGKVIRMDFSLGALASELLKNIPVNQVMIGPQEAKAWTEDVLAKPETPVGAP